MFKCEFCEEEVDRLFECLDCGAMVCEGCFNSYEELCVECAPDEDDYEDDDWMEDSIDDWEMDEEEDWEEEDDDLYPYDDEIPW